MSTINSVTRKVTEPQKREKVQKIFKKHNNQPLKLKTAKSIKF